MLFFPSLAKKGLREKFHDNCVISKVSNKEFFNIKSTKMIASLKFNKGLLWPKA